MTNWPNIQEYRNFEAKFIDISKQESASNSGTDGDSGFRGEIDADESTGGTPHGTEIKSVRCVIQKEFEDTFKKFDRGDGLGVVPSTECVRSKVQDPPLVTDRSAADRVRLQNHLKWKKQKEEEFAQKKEAERLAQIRKKEEEIRMEKVRKEKEKEREEKIREWQEAKAREKEGRKKEKLVMKVLENELKEVLPVVDKEKLIGDWVKLKDKQRQLEAEKKAKMLKREEESKALRQTLAALSYQQWKERVKGKTTTLPKNGYQIFGPKPVPVVKEDWNNDFTSSSPRRHAPGFGLRYSRSNTSTSLTFRPEIREFENLSKDMFYLGDIRNRGFSQLKTAKSGLSLSKGHDSAMPLKELQPETFQGTKKCGLGRSGSTSNFGSHYSQQTHTQGKGCLGNDEDEEDEDAIIRRFSDSLSKGMTDNALSKLLRLSMTDLDSSRSNSSVAAHGKTGWQDSADVQPKCGNPLIKKKLDLYINPPSPHAIDNFRIKVNNSKTTDGVRPKVSSHQTWASTGLRPTASQSMSRKFSSPGLNKSATPCRVSSDARLAGKSQTTKTRTDQVDADNKRSKSCRRSRSFDKPAKKTSKEQMQASSKAVTKTTEVRAQQQQQRDKSLSCPKRRVKKFTATKSGSVDGSGKERSAGSAEKLAQDPGEKPKKKPKKKSTTLSKSYSFTDSPYCSKKPAPKNSDKTKTGSRRKSPKDGGERNGAAVVGSRR